MWCSFPFPLALLGWKHLVLVCFSKGFDWSLSVYPVHEDILHSKVIRCGFVLSLGGYLGLEGPESGVLRRLSAMHWASSGHSGLLLPPVSLL